MKKNLKQNLNIKGKPIISVRPDAKQSSIKARRNISNKNKYGMVIAIGNCGLYLSEFGVRVEDTIAVTSKGYEDLTKYRKAL